MEKIKESIKTALQKELKNELGDEKIEIILEVPPKQDMGDYAFPCFTLSKKLKRSPIEIARELETKLLHVLDSSISAKAIGPYLNFFISKDFIAESIIRKIQEEKERYGRQKGDGKVILVESPGPNTNKPLHLGHLRNMLLGMSITAILRAAGEDAKIVNVVNDRGVHICKSMLAYKKFGNDETPKSAGRKSDHFVGDYYVRYSKYEKDHPEAEQEIQDMILKWEEGDAEVRTLWEKMNRWALDGFNETYRKLRMNIEKEYYESNIYMDGKKIIEQGLKEGIFQKNEEGAIIANLEERGLGNKVLIRPNGTSVYITQDIYMAKKRYDDFKFDEMIYIVGNEQEYHFKVLFEIFRKLDYNFAGRCIHFSYGMVELPEGKMKSREGNVVDTDDLIEEMTALAMDEVKKRYEGLSQEETISRAQKIAMAAIKFFFIKFDPVKNFIFNPEESLAFEGETGPYVQYAYARICSIFGKLEKDVDLSKANLSMLTTDYDKKLLLQLMNYPETLKDAAKHKKPSSIAHYLIDLASAFNEYYHANPILQEKEDIRDARLALADSMRIVIKSGLELLGIDVLEQM
jgi:arginyl-tRNA synthetase